MKDRLLYTIGILAEADEQNEEGMSLLVGGFLVSGVITGVSKYIQHNETVSKIWDTFEKLQSEHSELLNNSAHFIHMRDAHYFTPGQRPVPGNGGLYLRIPLEAVQGFSFGTMQAVFNGVAQ